MDGICSFLSCRYLNRSPGSCLITNLIHTLGAQLEYINLAIEIADLTDYVSYLF